MKVRKKGYWMLLALTIILTILTIYTLVPSESASKFCLLGYKAYCSFTPVSTILCALSAAMVCFIRKRFFVSYK